MKKKGFRFCSTFFRGVSTLWLAFFAIAALQAQSTHRLLRKGDRQYDLENYKESEKQYREAADRHYGDPRALYNLGNSLYQQGKWEDAATRFEQSAKAAPTGPQKADALHNLGNAYLKQQKYPEAITAYEQSLRIRPGDADTKQNLQMAKKKLKEEQQRQQQQQQQKDRKQEQQQNQDQQQQQSPQPQEQPRNQPQNKPQNQGQPQNQPADTQQQPSPADKLNKEEARRLLETAIGPEDRKNARKYREQRQQPMPSGKEKDW